MIPAANPFEERIRAAVSESIEVFAFEEAVLAGRADSFQADSGEGTWAEIPALDPDLGKIFLWLPSSVLQAFSTAISGGERDPGDQEEMLDVLRELTNTLAGRVMAARFSPKPFLLGLPKAHPGEAFLLPESHSVLKFLVTEGLVMVGLPKQFLRFEGTSSP